MKGWNTENKHRLQSVSTLSSASRTSFQCFSHIYTSQICEQERIVLKAPPLPDVGYNTVEI